MGGWWEDVFHRLFVDPRGLQSAREALSGLPGIGPLAYASKPGPGTLGPFTLYGKPGSAPSPAPPTPSPSPAPASPSPSTSPSPSPSPSPGQPGNEVKEAAQQYFGGAQQQNPLYPGIPNANVFMGWKTKVGKKPDTDMLSRYGRSGYHNEPNWVSMQEVIAQVNDWGPKERARFNRMAISAGLLKTPTNNLDILADKWAPIVWRTAQMNQRGHMLTPWQLLGRYANGELKKPGGESRTVTSTSINLTDAPTARAAINDALEAVLGRGATKAEKAKFQAALAAAEKKNPTKTTTTTNAKGTSVSSTTQQGLNPSTFAQDYALEHNTAEAQAYQAVTTYMNAFFQALSAPV